MFSLFFSSLYTISLTRIYHLLEIHFYELSWLRCMSKWKIRTTFKKERVFSWISITWSCSIIVSIQNIWEKKKHSVNERENWFGKIVSKTNKKKILKKIERRKCCVASSNKWRYAHMAPNDGNCVEWEKWLFSKKKYEKRDVKYVEVGRMKTMTRVVNINRSDVECPPPFKCVITLTSIHQHLNAFKTSLLVCSSSFGTFTSKLFIFAFSYCFIHSH